MIWVSDIKKDLSAASSEGYICLSRENRLLPVLVPGIETYRMVLPTAATNFTRAPRKW